MAVFFKLIFHPGTLFLALGLILIFLTLRGNLDSRPVLRWLGPTLVPAGIGLYIPMWLWQDSAILVALTLGCMGLQALCKRMTGLGIIAYVRSIPDRWAKLNGQ